MALIAFLETPTGCTGREGRDVIITPHPGEMARLIGMSTEAIGGGAVYLVPLRLVESDARRRRPAAARREDHRPSRRAREPGHDDLSRSRPSRPGRGTCSRTPTMAVRSLKPWRPTTSDTRRSLSAPTFVSGSERAIAVVAGATFTVTDTVKNFGVETAAPSITRFYLSLNTLLDAADIALDAEGRAGTRLQRDEHGLDRPRDTCGPLGPLLRPGGRGRPRGGRRVERDNNIITRGGRSILTLIADSGVRPWAARSPLLRRGRQDTLGAQPFPTRMSQA